MPANAFVPPGVLQAGGQDSGASICWTAEALSRVVTALADPGAVALASLSEEALLDTWSETVEAFLDPGSPERRALDPALARNCGLSPEGLAAGLEAVLGGVRRGPAEALFARARERRDSDRAIGGSSPEGLAFTASLGVRGEPAEVLLTRAGDPALVVLASNLPALAVQPLLPLLALRRPVLLKSPSAEPLFAPAFLAALARREPALALATAAVTWRGGDEELEAAVLPLVGPVLAYGDEPALASLSTRAPGRVIGYGPKTSLAILGHNVEIAPLVEGLARDIALFDQRGCLSIAAVYTAGNPTDLAHQLANALINLAERWPPGPADPATLAAVQQIRLEADLRGLTLPSLPPLAGTVLVEPDPTFRPSPGLRTLRIHPLADLARLPALLVRWAGRLQGAALAGDDAWALTEPLTRLGLSRFAVPGDLQSPDATWHNGGIDPLAALMQSAPRPDPSRCSG